MHAIHTRRCCTNPSSCTPQGEDESQERGSTRGASSAHKRSQPQLNGQCPPQKRTPYLQYNESNKLGAPVLPSSAHNSSQQQCYTALTATGQRATAAVGSPFQPPTTTPAPTPLHDPSGAASTSALQYSRPAIVHSVPPTLWAVSVPASQVSPPLSRVQPPHAFTQPRPPRLRLTIIAGEDAPPPPMVSLALLHPTGRYPPHPTPTPSSAKNDIITAGTDTTAAAATAAFAFPVVAALGVGAVTTPPEQCSASVFQSISAVEPACEGVSDAAVPTVGVVVPAAAAAAPQSELSLSQDVLQQRLFLLHLISQRITESETALGWAPAPLHQSAPDAQVIPIITVPSQPTITEPPALSGRAASSVPVGLAQGFPRPAPFTATRAGSVPNFLPYTAQHQQQPGTAGAAAALFAAQLAQLTAMRQSSPAQFASYAAGNGELLRAATGTPPLTPIPLYAFPGIALPSLGHFTASASASPSFSGPYLPGVPVLRSPVSNRLALPPRPPMFLSPQGGLPVSANESPSGNNPVPAASVMPAACSTPQLTPCPQPQPAT